MLTAVTSAVGLCIGEEHLKIPKGLKDVLKVATPFISMAVGALTKKKITNTHEIQAEKRLFRSEAFKKN